MSQNKEKLKKFVTNTIDKIKLEDAEVFPPVVDNHKHVSFRRLLLLLLTCTNRPFELLCFVSPSRRPRGI